MAHPSAIALGDSLTRETPCKLCGEDQFELIARRDRRGKELDTVVCKKCGLISHRHIPDDEALTAYYARQYRNDYHGAMLPSPHRVIRARGVGREILHQVTPFLQPEDSVFDVGAGIGCTIKAFEMAGYQASGIEPGEGFCEYSSQQLRTSITPTTLEEVPPVPQYDVVLLIHVIEHFHSPDMALAQIRRIMKPGGRLYVECPNFAAPHAAPGKQFHFAHIHNFTPSTLTMLGEACGFQVQQQLSGTRDTDLRILFSLADAPQHSIDPDSYSASLEAFTRYNSLTYHARPRYLIHRVGRMARHLSHHCFATRRLKHFLDQCQRHSAGSAKHEATPRIHRGAA